MAIIQKIHRITDLPELTNVSKSKVLVAYEGKNYFLNSDLIKGRKIQSITEQTSKENAGLNVIVIKFSDGTQSYLYVYNGSQGKKGQEGFEGPKGDTGNAAAARQNTITDFKSVLTIVNDHILETSNIHHTSTSLDHNEYCDKAWSAYRGKSANEEIEKLNETFVSDDEYDVLWNNIVYMIAEFTTEEDDHESLIFSNDTNSHRVYKKFWTYEEGDVATYYVAIYGNVYEYDEEGNKVLVNENVIVRYDPVVANLWTDIYMGADNGYFEATSSQMNDLTQLYVYDPNYPDNPYRPITIDTRERIEVEEGKFVTNENYNDKDFDFYSEGIKEYIHAHYTNTSNLWDYELKINAEDVYVKPLYEEDKENGETKYDEDGYEYIDYPLIPVTDYSKVDNYTKYYSANDKNSLIEDISEYLKTSNNRIYVKTITNAETGAYKYVEKEYDTLEDREAYINELESTYKDYIIVTIDLVEQSYTFDYHYVKTVRKDKFYENVTEVYKNGNVTLYAYFENRQYYTGEIVEQKNEETGETEYINKYTKIIKPSWIYAEFTTSYEDEEALILNSVKELGEEDNTTIDITSEDYEDIEDIEVVPIQFMAYEGMPTIYYYNHLTDSYDEVDINDIDISGAVTYYQIKGDYKQIDGDTALGLGNDTVLYIKISESTYMMNTEAISVDKTYYIWEETIIKIEDIAEFVQYAGVSPDTEKYVAAEILEEEKTYYRYDEDTASYVEINDAYIEEHLEEQFYEKVSIDNSNITIFTGIPEQLYIKFVPENATYKKATIEYDSDIVTLLEDGRICAISNGVDDSNLDENNEIHTTITLTPETGNPLVLNVKVLTPMDSIDMNLQNVKMNIGEDINIECIAKPRTTSNKRISLVADDIVEISEKTQNPGIDNKTTAKVKGIEKGTTTLQAVAEDGFGATKSCTIEVVKPVNSINWNSSLMSDLKYTEIKYTAAEVYEWNNSHPEDEAITVNDIKERRITVLKNVEYELCPLIDPADSSYPELVWSYPSEFRTFIKVENRTKTIVDEREQSHEATQEDIDNNLADEIGEIIIDKPAVTHDEPMYIIKGLNTTFEKSGIGGYVSEDEDAERVYITGELKNVYGNQTDKHPISSYVIVNQSVENITVTPSPAISFNIGTTKQFLAEVGPEEAVKDFTWSSTDNSVVTINQSGIATAVAPGNAKILATADDGSGVYDSCDILVTVPMSNIDFDSATNGIIYVGVGKTSTINVTLVYPGGYADAAENTKLGVDWSSSDTSIATVSAGTDKNSCTISGESLGTATIVAKAKDNSGTIGAIQVVVITAIESIEFDDEFKNITMDVNDSLSLMPNFNPIESTNQVLIWASSDESKASVNSSGIITAIAKTDKDDENQDIPVIITASTTDGSNKTATCNIIII